MRPHGMGITLAPKKLILTRRDSEGSAQSPRWRVGFNCARMRNFLAGVIEAENVSTSNHDELAQAIVALGQVGL